MRAAVYQQFQQPLSIQTVADPTTPENGVVIAVKACGICRSDWHGWMGNDPDIKLPHVPGHELAGTVEAAGKNVKNWRAGDRVTLPFVCGCGSCPQCISGNQQICDHHSSRALLTGARSPNMWRSTMPIRILSACRKK